MISAMTYLGLITALLLILCGFICFRWPRLLSFYSTMSPAELKNVDLKAAGRIYLITMSVTGVVSALVYYAALHFGREALALSLNVITIFLGVVVLAVLLKRCDGNPRKTRSILYVSVAVLAVLVLCPTLFSWSRPLRISLADGTLEIGGSYGMTLKASDIRRVDLRDSLPDIEMRTNGIGMGNIQKGHFLLKDIGVCRLYVDMDNPPFICLWLEDGEVIFLNHQNPAETAALYDALLRL